MALDGVDGNTCNTWTWEPLEMLVNPQPLTKSNHGPFRPEISEIGKYVERVIS